jgi:hypothetical protein
MKFRHSSDYDKYGNKIPQILKFPDYVRLNDDDGSIEYVKKFGKHVKVAVRIAGDGKYYARSLYIISKSRADYFIKTGQLKRLTKE